jgi:hypothetical protein
MKLKRPKFSLRTLFVVMTLIAITTAWVVYQLNWIRERRVARNWAIKHGVEYYYENGDPIKMSWFFQLAGEEGISGMTVRMYEGEDDKMLKELIRVYPECKVSVKKNWN